MTDKRNEKERKPFSVMHHRNLAQLFHIYKYEIDKWKGMPLWDPGAVRQSGGSIIQSKSVKPEQESWASLDFSLGFEFSTARGTTPGFSKVEETWRVSC